jgi:hypothetical protein
MIDPISFKACAKLGNDIISSESSSRYLLRSRLDGLRKACIMDSIKSEKSRIPPCESFLVVLRFHILCSARFSCRRIVTVDDGVSVKDRHAGVAEFPNSVSRVQPTRQTDLRHVIAERADIGDDVM